MSIFVGLKQIFNKNRCTFGSIFASVGPGIRGPIYTSTLQTIACQFLFLLAVTTSVISMAMEEGLVSTDVAVIKQARQVANGKVTRNINSLDFALVQDEEGKFIFNEINDKRLEEIYTTLLSSYEAFQELHDRHIEYASPGTDEKM